MGTDFYLILERAPIAPDWQKHQPQAASLKPTLRKKSIGSV
jgi:hypothetical protein